MKRIVSVFLFLLLIPGFAAAKNPVLVAPSDGDFTSIQAAIDSWCTGGANESETPPFVIDIQPGTPYIETMTLDSADTTGPVRGDIKGDLIIKSVTPGMKIDLRLMENGVDTTAGLRDGLWIYQEVHNITFTDIIFSPELTGNIDDDLVKIDKNYDSPANTITFNNCVFTDVKDGVGGPISTTRATAMPGSAVSNVGKLTTGDCLCKVWTDNAEYIIVKFNSCVFGIADCNGIQFGSIATPGGTYQIDIYECVFGYLGFNAGSSAIMLTGGGEQSKVVNIDARDARRGENYATMFYRGNYHNIYATGQDANAHVINLKNSIFYHISGVARPISLDSRTQLNMDRVMYYGRSTAPAAVVGGWGEMTWNRVTFGNASNSFLLVTPGAPATIVARDIICASPGTKIVANTPDATQVLDLDYVAFPATGPDAIGEIGTSPGLQLGANIVTADPQFPSRGPKTANMYDVVNYDYWGKGPGGEPLAGGANYIGITATPVATPTPSSGLSSDWIEYR